MKTKHITTSTAEIMAVGLPEGVSSVEIYAKPGGKPHLEYFHIRYQLPSGIISGFAMFYKYFGGKKNYPNDMELLGRLPDITEEQAAKVVEEWNMPFPNGESDIYYKDYIEDIYTLCSSVESLHSLLEANDILFENPLGKYPEFNDRELWGDPVNDSQVYSQLNYDQDKWQDAQSKVWNKENTYLFKKI